MLDTFLITSMTVALAEIGDRTQLLTLILLAKYKKPNIILFAIISATIINHSVSAWIGQSLSFLVEPLFMKWFLIISFLIFSVWVLFPDKLNDEDKEPTQNKYGIFFSCFTVFFIAEIGDKTQIATVALGAKYASNLIWVVVGSTVGMIIANYPVLIFGNKILKKISFQFMRRLTALMFLLLAVLTYFEFS